MESKHIEILAKHTKEKYIDIIEKQIMLQKQKAGHVNTFQQLTQDEFFDAMCDAMHVVASELTASHQAELKAKDEEIERLKDFIDEASRHIEFCQCDDPTHGDPLYCKRCNRLFELID